MQGPSKVIDAADSITLGVHGMPGVYLLRPGMADDIRPMISKLSELFSRITGEQLCGMAELYDGSLAYYRGDLDQAYVLTYKAIYLLEKTKQDVLKISAGEQLGMIATRQGNVDCFTDAIEYIDAAERGVNYEACKPSRIVDTQRAFQYAGKISGHSEVAQDIFIRFRFIRNRAVRR